MASVPEWITQEYIQNIVQICLKSPVRVLKSETVPASTEGLNYMSQLLRISLEYQQNGAIRNKSLIAKIKLTTSLTESFAHKFDNFQVETYFLQNIQPLIEEKLGKDFGPKLYYFDEVHNVLFLEDVSVNGFKPTPVHTFLDKNQCQLAIEGLAEMHGASLYILQKHPEFKNKFPSLIDDKAIWGKIHENTKAVLKKYMTLYGLSDDLAKKLMNFKDRYDLADGEVSSPIEGGVNVLAHCDASKNNVLFSYKDGVAQHSKWLDFQTISYNSFAHDLQNFISSSAQADVFVNHREFLLQKYFERLRQVAPDIPGLSLERIRNEFTQRNYLGFLVVVSFRPYILGDRAIDFDRLLAGEIEEVGFANPVFIEDIGKILPYLDSIGTL